MDEDMKKPCTPREEMSRDYNELGLHPHGETVKDYSATSFSFSHASDCASSAF